MSEGKKRKNNVTHTRAIQRDRSRQPLHEPAAEEIERLLEEVVSPITYTQIASYQAMGLRQRILTLPVMMAFVLSLLWRQVGSVTDAIRELNKRGILWARPTMVSQQAVSERLRTFPAALFYQVLNEVVPLMQQRWSERRRPLSEAMKRAQAQFAGVWILDGSTLDGVLRKVGLLRDGEGPVLAGRIAGLLNAASLLPKNIWYEEDSQAHDRVFWEAAVNQLEVGALLLFDLGFTNFLRFDDLTDRLLFFVTRYKKGSTLQIEKVLHNSAHLHDQLIWLGADSRRCKHLLRLVEVEYKGSWFRFLTNVLEPQVLSAAFVAQLYQQRWRIEDAFQVVKRQLGLAYFWVSSINGIKVQIWATWILYCVLVDLTDRIAEAMQRPMADISMEMVFKGLYHFAQEKKLGRAADPVAYLVEDAKLLGIVKHRNRPKTSLTT